MKMTGEQQIAAPRRQVWEALNDPEVLRRCIPGCQSLEMEGDDRLRAVAEIKIGPIGARFAGLVTLSDLDPPNGYTITGEGQGGTAGFAKGGAKVRLSDDAGGTKLSYDVDVQVGGRLAQLGGPIIDATAKQMAAGFFRQFSQIVAPPASGPTADAAMAAEGGAGPAATAANADARMRAPPPPPARGAAAGLPIAWVLALVVAALAGFLFGHGGEAGGGYGGISIGLLVVAVAAAAFEYGRRVAAPVLTLDAALIARLAEETRR